MEARHLGIFILTLVSQAFVYSSRVSAAYVVIIETRRASPAILEHC